MNIVGNLYISDLKYQSIPESKITTSSTQISSYSQLFINQTTYYNEFTDKISAYKEYSDEDGRQGLILPYFHTIQATVNFSGFINSFINIPIKIDFSINSLSIFDKNSSFHINKFITNNAWNTAFYKNYHFNNSQYQKYRKNGKFNVQS